MTDTTIDTLRNHWHSLVDGGNIPQRSQIAPREMPEILDCIFVLERLNPEDVRIRVAGLKISEMMGMEVRGQSPVNFFMDGARGRFSAVLNDVMNRPTIAHLGLATVDKMGNPGEAEMILLPLRSDFGDVSRVIGCISSPKADITAPAQFTIRTIDIESVTAAAPQPSFGFAETGRGFIMDGSPNFHSISGGGAQTTRKSHHLRLVN